METLLQDIRFGIRMLLKSPGVSIVATIALALGIGANTAIFTVVNAVLLRPLPFPKSDEVMSVFETDLQRGQSRGSYSYPNFFDLREQNHVFERVACHHTNDFILTGHGEPARLLGAVVSADLFPLLEVAPMYGRTFVPDEEKPGDRGRVVILSQALFQKFFGGDPNIVNQQITLDGQSYTVVGVMPQSFEFPIQNEPVQLWTTTFADASGSAPMTKQRGAHYLRITARLKPGVTKEQAQADVNTVAARLQQQYPD